MKHLQRADQRSKILHHIKDTDCEGSFYLKKFHTATPCSGVEGQLLTSNQVKPTDNEAICKIEKKQHFTKSLASFLDVLSSRRLYICFFNAVFHIQTLLFAGCMAMK